MVRGLLFRDLEASPRLGRSLLAFGLSKKFCLKLLAVLGCFLDWMFPRWVLRNRICIFHSSEVNAS